MKTSTLVKYSTLIVLSLIFIFPLVSLLMVAIRPYDEILRGWWHFGKFSPSLRGFINSWLHKSWPLGRGLINSFMYVAPSTLVSVFMSLAAAYFLSRYKIFGKKIILGLFLVFYGVALQVFIIPLFKIIRFLNLINNLSCLFIMHISLSFLWIVPFYYNFMKLLPKEVEEAAKIDGASDLTIIKSIIIPIAMPAIISMAVLQFTLAWGEFFLPLVFIYSVEKFPCVLQAPKFVGYMSADLQSTAAAAIWTMIPPLCVYVLFRKYFIKGMTGLIGR